MKRRTLVLGLAVLVVGGGVAWSSLQGPAATKVKTSLVERVPELRAIVQATGEIRAKEFVDIQAEVPGVIVELAVREGDTVEKGAVLLRLDDLQLKAEEDSARAQVGSAEADAKNAEVSVATAEANLAGEHTALANLRTELVQAEITAERAQASQRRKKELFDGGLLGSEEFEIATADARLAEQRRGWNEARVLQGEANLRAVSTRIDAAKAQLDGAKRRVEAAKAALARAVDQTGKTVLRAPLSGLITKLNVEKGERAVPGIQSNPVATLMTIADMSVIEAEIQVAEADIVNVALGAVASVEVDALRDVQIRGAVTEIGHSPIQASSAQNGNGQNQEGKDFKVVVRLLDPPASLRPGFTAQAEIVTAVRADCLVVPLQALTAREVEIDAEGRYLPPPEQEPMAQAVHASPSQRATTKELEGVFLLRDGRARFCPVKTGITGDMDIELLAGLDVGAEVVSGPYQVLRTLKEWDRIAIDAEKQKDDAIRLRKKKR